MLKRITAMSAAFAIAVSVFTYSAGASSLLDKLGTVHNLRDYEPTRIEVLTKVVEQAKNQSSAESTQTKVPVTDNTDNAPQPVILPSHDFFEKSPSSVFKR